MKRFFLTAALVLGFATVASGATLTLTADKSTYVVGEQINLTLFGTHTSGESADSVYARVLFDATKTDFVSASQELHSSTSFGTTPWVGDADQTSAGGDGAATLLNQFITGGANRDFDGESNASAVLVAEAAGTVNVAYVTSGGNALNYFGLTNAPGTSFNIIPEPTVASLIGLGLIGLAIGGRNRS